MVDWHAHWNTMPAGCAAHDVLRQVGKTVCGCPVDDTALDAIVSDVAAALRLHQQDGLLDLCCGNGIVTERCALICHDVSGVDFSAPLLRIALDRRPPPNVRYLLGDVRSLPAALNDRRYSKVLMYEGAQHLDDEDMERLLAQLRTVQAPGAPVLVASIPDRERIGRFYDTPARWDEYVRRTADGTEAIGRWWTEAEMVEIGRRAGYRGWCLPQNPALHTAHYRFDALFTP